MYKYNMFHLIFIYLKSFFKYFFLHTFPNIIDEVVRNIKIGDLFGTKCNIIC